MRNIKILSAICLGLFITVLVICLSQPPRTVKQGATWQQPRILDSKKELVLNYGKLEATGDAVYYRLSIDAPLTIKFQIDIARHASPKFAPQLVVFEPYTSTIGPILPLEQPPQTIALVYPMTTVKEAFNPATQTAYAVRLEAQPELKTPGTYLIAVYNAGSAGGAYRLTMGDHPMTAGWQDTWMMPIFWWHDQTFTGFSWLTLIFPLILALLVWLVYLRLDHHQLHVHKTYSKPAPKRNVNKPKP